MLVGNHPVGMVYRNSLPVGTNIDDHRTVTDGTIDVPVGNIYGAAPLSTSTMLKEGLSVTVIYGPSDIINTNVTRTTAQQDHHSVAMMILFTFTLLVKVSAVVVPMLLYFVKEHRHSCNVGPQLYHV